MTSSLNIAARIVIWPTPSAIDSREVLLKTYNDNQWHTEIIDLSFFGISGNIHRVELGFITLVTSNSNESVCYADFSFNRWQVDA